MKRVTVCYARFLSPGSIVSNDWTVPMQTTDPHAVPWPENAYAFILYERVDVQDGAEMFKGEAKQIGPVYYHPDSKVLTQAEVAVKDDPRDSILLENMRRNDWPSVIYSRWGNWPQPYEAGKCKVLGHDSNL